MCDCNANKSGQATVTQFTDTALGLRITRGTHAVFMFEHELWTEAEAKHFERRGILPSEETGPTPA